MCILAPLKISRVVIVWLLALCNMYCIHTFEAPSLNQHFILRLIGLRCLKESGMHPSFCTLGHTKPREASPSTVTDGMQYE